jgi:hypothetical protein
MHSKLKPKISWLIILLFAGFSQCAMATGVWTAIYSVSVIVGLCLLWQFVQGWRGRKT